MVSFEQYLNSSFRLALLSCLHYENTNFWIYWLMHWSRTEKWYIEACSGLALSDRFTLIRPVGGVKTNINIRQYSCAYFLHSLKEQNMSIYFTRWKYEVIKLWVKLFPFLVDGPLNMTFFLLAFLNGIKKYVLQIYVSFQK